MKRILFCLLFFSSFAAIFTETNSFTDPRDKQVYKTITIGKQVWMAENFKYEVKGLKYKMCQNYDDALCKKYGRLYDWESAQSACPKGWHLPSDEEWTELTNFLGGDSIAAKKLIAPDGFAALPGGLAAPFIATGEGGFDAEGSVGSFWTSTPYNDGLAWERDILFEEDTLIKRFNANKATYMSVRYVKD